MVVFAAEVGGRWNEETATFLSVLGKIKDVRVYSTLYFGHFLAPSFSRCFYPIMNFGHLWASPSPLTFHNVNNHGGSENCQGMKNSRKQRKQHKTNRNKTTKKDTGSGTHNKVRVFLVKTSSAEGRRRFHKNTLMPV